MTAATGEARRDLWEADDHVTSDQFRTGLADALMKFCRGLLATTNLIYLSRQIPLLRERLIVLLSGGEALVCRVVHHLRLQLHGGRHRGLGTASRRVRRAERRDDSAVAVRRVRAPGGREAGGAAA